MLGVSARWRTASEFARRRLSESDTRGDALRDPEGVGVEGPCEGHAPGGHEAAVADVQVV